MIREYPEIEVEFCGERGIRTPGPPKGSTVFETAPFDRSGISPGKRKINFKNRLRTTSLNF
jgi:hypothetical protein